MSLKIIKAGILDSIQDTGRYGWQHLGINPSGAMDKFSAKAANILVGNNPHEAVIEIHFPASIFLFEKSAIISFCGADFPASVNGESVPSSHVIIVNKNSVLQFQEPKQGARIYIAIKGGLDIQEWLGSRSTHLKAKAGGFNGRGLKKNDRIDFRETYNLSSWLGEKEFIILPWQADLKWNSKQEKDILILAGNEWHQLSKEAKEIFLMTPFVITNQSDRMGYRLNNIPLSTIPGEEVVSSAVRFGTIQVLPDGKLIILMSDHQTTGGYPRIAHIISAYHSTAAQLKPGDNICFRFTDQQIAENLLIKQEQYLRQLQESCTFRLNDFF